MSISTTETGLSILINKEELKYSKILNKAMDLESLPSQRISQMHSNDEKQKPCRIELTAPSHIIIEERKEGKLM